MMDVLGMKNRLSGVLAFTGIALPIYLVGCLGLRVIGVPAILKAIFHPNQKSGLRFVLAFFVVLGLLITLTCGIVPAGLPLAYHNNVWFLAQSKYVAWIFAVEVLQPLYRHLVARGAPPGPVAGVITLSAIALSCACDRAALRAGARSLPPLRRAIGEGVASYSLETLSVIDFLAKDAQLGDVVLPDENLLAPTLALTKCRVPLGYFSIYMVAQSDNRQRDTAQKEFWKAWRLGHVRGNFLRKVGVRYVAVSKQSKGIPAKIPAALRKVFENSEFAVFEVQGETLSETTPEPITSLLTR